MFAVAEDLASLKARYSLQYFQSRLKLEKRNSEYVTRCVWHPDKTPSFTIRNEGREWRFKCFGGCPDKPEGDVISFIQKSMT